MSPLLLVAVTGAVLVMTMAAIYASATRRRPPESSSLQRAHRLAFR